jgi:hypothetical protein
VAHVPQCLPSWSWLAVGGWLLRRPPLMALGEFGRFSRQRFGWPFEKLRHAIRP